MTLFELEAILTLDGDSFSQDLKSKRSESKSFAQSIGADAESIKAAFTDAFSFSVGQLMAEGFLSFLGFSRDFIQESIKIGSAMEQTDEKIKVLFGEDGAATIDAWSYSMKEGFGISRQAAKEYAATIGGLYGSDLLGYTPEELAEMSMNLVELAGDLASFHNMSIEEVWHKLLSGMRGETEAIEDLGIDMRASVVGPYFGMTAQMWGALDQRERVDKSYEYIMASTTKAHGDFARTNDTFNNQMSIFMANVEELKGIIGEGLLPAATSLVQFMNTLFGDGKSGAEVVDELSASLTTTYGEIAVTTSNALALIDTIERMQEDGIDTAEEFEAFAAVLTELQTLIPSVSGLIDMQTLSIIGGTEALRGHVAAWGEDSRAMARSSIMNEYYDELARQEVETEKARLKYEAQYLTWQGYMDLESQLLTQAEEHLMETYPSKYPTYASMYANQYGQQDRTSGLLWQLKLHSKNDPTAKALYDSILSAQSSATDNWYGDELDDWNAEKEKLSEMETEVSQLEIVMANLMAEDEEEKAAELERLKKERDQLHEAAVAVIEETNKSIDDPSSYDPARLSEGWRIMNLISPNAARSLSAYLAASGGVTTDEDGWAKGARSIILPEDFFQISDGKIVVKDWQSELDAFKAARLDRYLPEDFFSDYDSVISQTKTTNVAEDALQMLNENLPTAVEDGTQEGARRGVAEGLAGMSINLDGQALASVVSGIMARNVRNGRYTGGGSNV